MENKENNNIFNLVADTIMKWYEQTHTTMTTVKMSSRIDVELMGILLVAKEQTLGVLTTLANNHVLSTHVLLRILTEIHIVLNWFLDVPEKNDKKTKPDTVYERLRRWDYTRLEKDKTLFQNLPQTSEVISALTEINLRIEELKKTGIKEMPNYKQLYESLGTELVELYAKAYMKYSRAVHLNRNVTQKLAWIHSENGKPKAILYNNNIDPDGNELIIIVSISSDINKAIRNFYDWQSEAMQNEYERLISKLEKK